MRRLSRSVVAAALAAVAGYLVRRARRPAARVDVYFADGSMVSLAAGSLHAERLLAHAREMLSVAGGRP